MKFLRMSHVALVSLFALFLSGCVSVPPSVPFNAELHDHVETIEVLPMSESEPSVLIVNHPGQNFGLVGALVAEGHMSSRRSWFDEQLAATDFDHVAVFTQTLAEQMQQRGYQLAWANGRVEGKNQNIRRKPWGTRNTYSTPSVDGADAMLDVNFGFVGYASAGGSSSSPYRPTVVVTARLVDSSGEEEMFFERLVYHDVFTNKHKSIVIQPESEYRYENFDAMQEAGSDVVNGFEKALEMIAVSLAEQFKARQ